MRVEAQTRITQLGLLLVHRDGGERELGSMEPLELRNESSRESHRSGTIDGHSECKQLFTEYTSWSVQNTFS